MKGIAIAAVAVNIAMQLMLSDWTEAVAWSLVAMWMWNTRPHKGYA